MAKAYEFTEEEQQQWEDWLSERPDHVRAFLEKLPPNELFWMDGQRVVVLGGDDTADGFRLQVAVLGKYNYVGFERRVFGIDPKEVGPPADLPADDEVVGAVLTQEQVDELRVKLGPGPELKQAIQDRILEEMAKGVPDDV